LSDDADHGLHGRTDHSVRVSVPTWFSLDDETGIAYLRFRSPDQWGEVAQSEHVELAD
jgi:hypothetical protein